MPEEFLCKDKFGKDVYWDPNKFCEMGFCGDCKLEKGKCPNKYISKEDGDAWYCIWFQPKKK